MFKGFHFTEESKQKMRDSAKKRKPNFLGKHHTEETKSKIRKRLLGRKLPLEIVRKMSETRKKMGIKSWQPKGYRHSQETIEKIRQSNKGKVRSDEAKEKYSEIHKKLIEEGNNFPPSRKGKKETIEQRKRKSLISKGEKNHNWKGGITTENLRIRGSLEYRIWREAVFKRDNWTCIWCSQHGGHLNADHIKPFAYFPELRSAIDNGRTLCKKCHKTTETYGNRYKHHQL
jgi:hypothetical protein